MAHIAAFVLLFWRLSLNFDIHQGRGSSRSQHPEGVQEASLALNTTDLSPETSMWAHSIQAAVSPIPVVLPHGKNHVYFAVVKY